MDEFLQGIMDSWTRARLVEAIKEELVPGLVGAALGSIVTTMLIYVRALIRGLLYLVRALIRGLLYLVRAFIRLFKLKSLEVVFNKWFSSDGKRENIETINGLFEAKIGPLKPDAAPIMFLQEKFQIVDFQGREKEIEELVDWAHCAPPSNEKVSIALVTGGPGKGKSRLVRELCKRVRTDRSGGIWFSWLTRHGRRNEEWDGGIWIAGFLRTDIEKDDLLVLMKQQRPMLLVIDDAERRGEQVKELVEAVFASDRKNDVRILLIARTRDGWWHKLEDYAEEKIMMLNPFKEAKQREVKLHSIKKDLEKEYFRQEFNRALKAFLEKLSPEYRGEPVRPRGKKFLGAMSPKKNHQMETAFSRVKKFPEASSSENNYWRRMFSLQVKEFLKIVKKSPRVLLSRKKNTDETLKDDIPNHLLRTQKIDVFDIHVAALLRAYDMLAASDNKAGNRKDSSEPPMDRLFKALISREVGGWKKAIEREDLTGKGLADDRRLRCVIAWLATTDDITSQEDAEKRLNLLPNFDGSECEDLAKIAATLYPYSGDDKAWWGSIAPKRVITWLTKELDDTIEKHPEVVAHLPEVALVNLLRHLTWRARLYGGKGEQTLENAIRADNEKGIVAAIKAGEEVDDPIDQIAARVLCGLGSVEAEKIAHKAYRHIHIMGVPMSKLAHASANILYEGTVNYSKERAKWARNLGIRCANRGEFEKAISLGEEAVGIFRKLKGRSIRYQRPLANSIFNLAVDRLQCGEYKEASDNINEAEEIYHKQERAGLGESRSDRADCLFMLSSVRFELGQHEDALKVANNAKKSYLKLEKDLPAEFPSDLARKLKDGNALLSSLGKRQEEAFDNVREICRKMAETMPKNFHPDLMERLRSLSDRPPSFEQWEEKEEKILGIIMEAEDIFAKLEEALPESIRLRLVKIHNLLNRVLSALGRREEALKAAEEAEKIYRELEKNYLTNKFRLDLARTLLALSVGRSGRGKRKEALDAAEEAEKIYCELAKDLPGRYRSGWAESLNRLSNRLSALGRRKDAFKAAKKAEKNYCEEAKARPDTTLPDLARSRHDLSNCLFALGWRKCALNAAKEAEKNYREVAKTRPDKFLPDLARIFNDQSAFLSALGEPEKGLKASQKAVAICCGLTKNRPDEFRHDLAASLHNLSARLSDLERHDEALMVIRKAVNIRRKLAKDLPPVFLPYLAASLHHQGNRLSALGQREEKAFKIIKKAGEICFELANARPEQFRSDLAASLHNQGNRLSALGHRKEKASGAIREAEEICHELAETLPEEFRPDLVEDLHGLSNRLSTLGHRKERAFEAIGEAEEIYRELVEILPEKFRHDLTTGLRNLGNRLSALEPPIGPYKEKAFEAIGEAEEIYRGLVELPPKKFRYGLAARLHNLCNRLSRFGLSIGLCREKAHDVLKEPEEIYRESAEILPEKFRHDLAASLHDLSACLSDLGRDKDALRAIEKAVAIRRKLVEDMPKKFLPDLARSLHNLGNCRSDLEQPQEKVLEAIEEAEEIYRKLAEGQKVFRSSLANSLHSKSSALLRLGQPQAALDAAEKAEKIYSELAENQPDKFCHDLKRSSKTREGCRKAYLKMKEVILGRVPVLDNIFGNEGQARWHEEC